MSLRSAGAQIREVNFSNLFWATLTFFKFTCKTNKIIVPLTANMDPFSPSKSMIVPEIEPRPCRAFLRKDGEYFHRYGLRFIKIS